MLADRISRLTSSLVRDILAEASSSDVTSFAGGLPASAALYRPDLNAMSEDELHGALQYGPSEGEPALRAMVARRMAEIGLACSADQVLILNGSQQGIDLVTKLVVDEGSRVLVESPSYLAALQSFTLFGAELCDWLPGATVPQDARLAYLTPTFRNPTGETLDVEGRIRAAAALDAANALVFEDDPYRELAFDRPAPAPLVSHLSRARWVYQGSFSKIMAPGLRLGFLVAHPDVFAPLLKLKQSADLHSNRLSQLLILRALHSPVWPAHLAKINTLYRAQRDAMQDALERHLAGLATWTLPEGGLFFWLRLNQKIDTMALMRALLAEDRVAVMPGEPFFAHPSPASWLRLNFSHATPERIDAGVACLARRLSGVPA
ncbi:aminotransferase-like domain-containing protein [Chitinibacteraceae bacterium HSL-7]